MILYDSCICISESIRRAPCVLNTRHPAKHEEIEELGSVADEAAVSRLPNALSDGPWELSPGSAFLGRRFHPVYGADPSGKAVLPEASEGEDAEFSRYPASARSASASTTMRRGSNSAL